MDGPGSDTLVLDLDDRHLDLWRDDVCDRMLDADAPWAAGHGLALHIELVARGGLVSLAIDSATGGPGLARDRRRIAAGRSPRTIGLTVVTAGSAEVDAEGKVIELAAGDVCLLTSETHFKKRLGTGYAESFLYCPLALADAAFGRSLPDLEPGVAPRTPLTAILADTLVSLRRHARSLAAEQWTPLVGAVANLTTAAFAPRTPPPADELASAAEVAWRARIDRHIDDHLGEPELTPPAIATALRISLRYLHRLYESSGASVAATIGARRLDRARALLLERRRMPVAQVAAMVGFVRPDHFAHAFRARFGVTARDLRAAAPRPRHA